MSKDIVTDILERAAQVAMTYLANEMGFEQSAVDAISQQIMAQDSKIRQEWGKSKHYVPATAPGVEEAKQKALEELRRTGRVAETASKHGISRATMYRLLKK